MSIKDKKVVYNYLLKQTKKNLSFQYKPTIKHLTAHTSLTQKEIENTWKQLKDKKVIKLLLIYPPDHLYMPAYTINENYYNLHHKNKLYLNPKKARKVINYYRSLMSYGNQATMFKVRVPIELTAIAMATYYHFTNVIDKENHSKLMMYINNPHKVSVYGTYTSNEKVIRHQIHFVDPNFSNSRYDDLLDDISSMATTIHISKQKDYIPVQNGLFNPQAKQLQPFTPKYVCDTKIQTPYQAFTKEPSINGWTVDKFINTALCHDKKEIQAFWQMLNATFNLNQAANRLFWLKGTFRGGNGKSTVEQLIKNIVGDNNCDNLRITDMGHPFSLMGIPGTLCCIGDNVDANARITKGESNLHSLITGDGILINPKNETPYNYDYTGSIIQSSNGLPRFVDNSGMQRRILIFNFNHEFINNSQEDNQIKKDYINNPKIREFTLYQALNIPSFTSYATSKKAKITSDELMINSDPIIEFAHDIIIPNKLPKIPTRAIYQVYQQWIRKYKYHCQIPTFRAFTQHLDAILGNQYQKARTVMDKCSYQRWQKFITNYHINIPISLKQYRCLVIK